MKKRLLAYLMSLCMVLSLIPVTAMADSTGSFTDVSVNDWYYQVVTWAADEGIIQGATETTFAPETNATRGEIVYALHQLVDAPATEKVAPFLDVTNNMDCADAVAWAAENKIVSGYNAQTFGPNDPVTREQMSAILYRFAKYLGADTSAETSLQVFSDYGKVDAYAVDAMEWACAEGLFSGMGDGTLNPDGFITRAQVASILYRYDVKLNGDTSKDAVEEDKEDAKEFTVTFDLNYGDKDADEVTVEEGDTVDKPENPSRSKYRFLGWYTKASGGEKFDFDTEITEDTTLYAHWQKRSSGGGGGSSKPSHTHDFVYDMQKTEPGWHICECDETELCKPDETDGDAVTCSVCGADYVVAAEATFEAENEKIVNEDDAGLESYGTVKLKDVEVNAGTSTDYALIFRGGKADLTDVDVTSGGGGIGAVDGAKVTFNGGEVAVNTASTSGRYNFYAEGAGTEITIEDGTFSFSKTLNQKRAYIYAGADTTVYVKGGNFGPASTRSGYTAGIMGPGKVIITGGTFGFDPTAWVADGYVAVKDGSNWNVIQCAHASYTTAEGYHECDVCHVKEMCTPDETDGDAVTCSVCKKGYVVAAEASFEAKSKKIVNNGAGLESYGSVTLKDVEVNAGSPADYALIFKGGEADLENVALDSKGGGVGVVGGADVTFDGGEVAVNTASTSGRYNFYVVDEGSTLTIKDGNFSFSKTLNQKRAYIYAGAGATVTVEGGTFGPASTRSGYTAGIMGDGTVIITGGTFGFDPTNWVADGYEAVKSGNTWTVSAVAASNAGNVFLKAPLRGSAANSLNSAQIVNNPEIEDVAMIGDTGYDTLQDAFTAAVTGDTVTLIANISFDTDDAYKANGSHLTMLYINGKNITLDMNGKTISVDYQSTTDMLVSVIHVADGAGLTVVGNGTIDVARVPVVGSNTMVAYMFRKQGTTGSLVIENGYYHMVNAEDSMIYTNGSEIVTVNGGTFVLDEVGTGSSGDNGCPWMFNCEGSNQRHVLVNGGSFNADITDPAVQHWVHEVKIADGMIVKEEDGMYHVIYPNISITRDGDTTYYDTMTSAIADAQDGDTIVLAQDIQLDETAAAELDYPKLNSDRPQDEHVTLFNVAGKSITIDLNGNEIYAEVTNLPEGISLAGIFSTMNGGHLTLKDSANGGVVEVKAVDNFANGEYANVYAMIINLDDTSSIVIESGTYILDRSVSSMIDTRSNEGVIVNGGTFDLGNVKDPGLKNGQAWMFNAKGQNTRHVIVTGGTFPADIQHQYYPFEVSMAKELALDYDAETGMYTVVPAVAYVNEQEFSGRWYTNEVGYATLEEAYAAVEAPKTSWDGQVSEQEYVTSLIADYYGSLADAFGEGEPLVDIAGAAVSVAKEDDNKVVTLLSDVELTETLNIEENATLVLNGNEITSTSEVAIRTKADVVIDGTAEGSAVTVNAPAGQKGTVLSAMAGKLTVDGGTYTSNTSYKGTKTAPTQVIYTAAGTTLNVDDATVVITNAGTGFAAGIRVLGDAVIKDSTIIAEGNYGANAKGNDYGSASYGIVSAGDLELYDCYVWGAHSGVSANGSVTVDRGTYEGYGHGGFYLSGAGTTSYLYNATINWAPMRDGFEDDGIAGTNGTGMYIGGKNGTIVASNSTVYIDGCTFNTVDANGFTYENWTPPLYGIVLRTSSAESNNTVYISNSDVERAGKVMFRGVGTNGHTVYNGVGNDWSKAKTVHSSNATYFIDTDDTYADGEQPLMMFFYEDEVVVDAAFEDEIVVDEVVENEEAADEVVENEEVADEVVTDEVVENEEVADEVVENEEVADEVVTDEVVENEEVADEEVVDEEVADEEVADEEVADEVVANEEVADEVVENEVVEETAA